MNVSHETIEASTATAIQGETITLKSNAWRACELTLRVNDSGDLECAAYAPRRAYNRFMCLAFKAHQPVVTAILNGLRIQAIATEQKPE
jgi:hypothetical protein